MAGQEQQQPQSRDSQVDEDIPEAPPAPPEAQASASNPMLKNSSGRSSKRAVSNPDSEAGGSRGRPESVPTLKDHVQGVHECRNQPPTR
jgi:hypothetical protein